MKGGKEVERGRLEGQCPPIRVVASLCSLCAN